jgi:low temperature requirement protein LtrA
MKRLPIVDSVLLGLGITGLLLFLATLVGGLMAMQHDSPAAYVLYALALFGLSLTGASGLTFAVRTRCQCEGKDCE